MDQHQLAVMIPIVGSVSLFLMIFGIRYLVNQENMALIEKGIDPRDKKNATNPSGVLKWGLMFIGAGIGLFLAILFSRSIFSGLSEGETTGLYFAMVAIFGGGGMLAAYFYERKNPPKKEEV